MRAPQGRPGCSQCWQSPRSPHLLTAPLWNDPSAERQPENKYMLKTHQKPVTNYSAFCVRILVQHRLDGDQLILRGTKTSSDGTGFV